MLKSFKITECSRKSSFAAPNLIHQFMDVKIFLNVRQRDIFYTFPHVLSYMFLVEFVDVCVGGLSIICRKSIWGGWQFKAIKTAVH